LIIEFNLIIFIPLLLNTHLKNSSLTALKYFIPQAIGSILILFFIILGNQKSENLLFLNNHLLSIGIILKIGLIPFHSWFVSLITKVNFINIFLLIT
jgi:NADH:ubiquinone oxidoreductase subunit 2 (subunit N)